MTYIELMRSSRQDRGGWGGAHQRGQGRLGQVVAGPGGGEERERVVGRGQTTQEREAMAGSEGEGDLGEEEDRELKMIMVRLRGEIRPLQCLSVRN